MNYEKDLSIIIPFVGEHPQAMFTIQTVAQSLIGSGIDFEILAVDNWCEQAKEQAKTSAKNAFNNFLKKQNSINPNEDENAFYDSIYEFHKSVYPTYENRSGEAIKAASRINDWLVYLEVKDTLSHWECKRQACKTAKGKHLLFVDAHTVPSKNAIMDMFNEYNTDLQYQGTIHLPLTYKILESHRLIYKLKCENNFYGYSFTGFSPNEKPYEVPCMSTCGMMISHDIYNKIGGWPKNMTMYGGGENYINYSLSVCGYKKFIFPHGTLHHHGDKRDYHYNYDGLWYNRFIAHYLFGGEKVLNKLVSVTKGKPTVLYGMVQDILKTQKEHRNQIKSIQVCKIEEWIKKWI